jgi:hypothetical protein
VTLTIKTNNKPRQTVPGFVLFNNQAVRSQFDFLTDEEFRDESFVKYHGWWYSMGDFLCVSNKYDPDFKGWDGYHSDSYFSGVLMKWADESGEEVIMGRYYS